MMRNKLRKPALILLFSTLAWIAVLLPAAREVHSAGYVVTTTADSGPGSLRQAILDANASPGLDTITFAIGTQGSQQIIQPLTALPTISDPVMVDGWSQGGSGYAGPPLVAINGGLTSGNVVGLNITAGSSTVRGLVFTGFIGSFASGIRLQTGGTNWIYGCYFGVNFDGVTRAANQRGIWIEAGSSSNRVGTNADGVNDTAERNIISANIDQNIWIYQPTTQANKIMGNYIGLNAAGTGAVGTTNNTVAVSGILVQGAANTIIGTDGDGQGDTLEGNVIGGSTYNIQLSAAVGDKSTDTRISGNLIGTNASGNASVGLQVDGVRVMSADHTLIGTDGDGVSDALEGNLISGNSDFGIMLQQTAALNSVVAGNIIGADITGMISISNGFGGSPRAGISLGGYGNRIGTNSDGISDSLERNLISGNTMVSVYAIYFNNLPNPDAPPTIIAGNWMGVDATGLAALPNNVGIGGMSSVPVIIRNNVISANTHEGIHTHSAGMVVAGNFIGVGADGLTELGNGYHGIYLSNNDNVIGGVGPGEANIIAHNGYASANYPNGIRISNTALRNTIRGNQIFNNAGLAIDLLWPGGVNINDDEDGDTGGNNLQNYPVITLAQSYEDGTTRLQGTLNSNPNTEFILDFYYSPEADAAGYGEGQYYLGEASLTTDADGNALFDILLPVTIPANQFVAATATHTDGSTSEFSQAFAAGGIVDRPVEGLVAAHTGLGYIDTPITFAAAITAGTGVSFAWDLGDGSLVTGALVEHIYTIPGTYTATVTASNNSSSAQAQTVVTVIEPANINGLVWNDLDLDGILGIGESGLAGVVVSAIGPTGTLTTTTDSTGHYQIFTPSPGLYTVNVGASSTAPAYMPTTPSQVPIPMSASGGTVVNFGLHETPPEGYGVIAGRAWIDLDGSGFPEPGEEPLPGLEISIYPTCGPSLITSATDLDGLFHLTLPIECAHIMYIYAPGYFPPERRLGSYSYTVIWIKEEEPLQNQHAPFDRGGTVGGRVTNTSGVGLPNTYLNISKPYNVTATDIHGDYAFFDQEPGSQGLGILPPYPYVNASGNGFRVFSLPPNSFWVENWVVEERGRFVVGAQQHLGNQVYPVQGIFFELQGTFVDQLLMTRLNGESIPIFLDAGVYTVTVLPEYLPPNTIVSPLSRQVVVTNETFASAFFDVSPAQSLAVGCQAGGQGFACTVEVYDSDGNLVASVDLTTTDPETVLTDLPPGSYEVVIIPAEPGWPESSTVVSLDGNTHAEFGYPFNPSNLQSISGYAYWDRCYPSGVRSNTTNCTETNIPSNNDIPVHLYDAAGTLLTTTVTSFGAAWNTGYYIFPDLAVGSYRVEIVLPGGFVSTSAVSAWRHLDGYASPEQLNFAYSRTEDRFLTGYVFADINQNSSYDLGLDTPWAGAAITITTLDGTLLSTQTSASDGSFYLAPLTSGEYRVEMQAQNLYLTRVAVIPASGGIPWVQFPLPPNDTRPRAIVFVDSNQNGQVDPSEQRLGGVEVALYNQVCGGTASIAIPIETLATNTDGLVLFTNPLSRQAAAAPPGSSGGCVQIVTNSLPANLAPANPNGASMPKNNGIPVLLPVYPQGTLLVQVFWDVDGDGYQDSGEPYLGGGTATIAGQTKSYSENGALFSLPTSSTAYNLSIVPPAGYLIPTAQPIPVVGSSGATTRKVAVQVAGGIHGAVIGPDQESMAASLAGLIVRLTHLATNQVYTTTAANGCAGWCSQAFFQFNNLPTGQYRLGIGESPLSGLPPGYLLASEPVVHYAAAGQTIQQNLMLSLLGYLTGIVYLDDNLNGQRDPGEAPASGYGVTLLSNSSLPVQTTVTDASGVYLFTNLSAGVRYLPTVDLFVSQAASLSDSLTEAPGWFVPGQQPVQANIGIFQGGTDHNYNTVYGRVMSGGAGVAGLRIGYYHWVPGEGCQQANPAWQNLETTSDVNGDYKLLTYMLPGSEYTYCIAARDSFGYQQSYNPATPATGSNFSYQTTGGAIIYHPGYWQRNIFLYPVAASGRSGVGPVVTWAAFRDDNLNAVWDEGEPALPVGNGVSSVSLGGDTTGVLSGLPDALHTLAIVPPAGYLSVQPTDTVSLWLSGADVALPPLPFYFAGAFSGQVFRDDDGDGWQRQGEAGVPGVQITLTLPGVERSAPAFSATVQTDALGRFSLPNLPAETSLYTLSVTSPEGFAPVAPRLVSVEGGPAGGAVISLALAPLNQVSGAVYDDWDADGRRGADEPLVSMPITLTLPGISAQRTALGVFHFWDVAPGEYTLIPGWLAVQPQEVQAAAGGALGLPAVPPGVVRGTAWLDENQDGLRQPWEVPLVGINVSLGGNFVSSRTQAAVTDQNGRFVFYQVAPGRYPLTLDLPAGLQAGVLGESTLFLDVSAERGAAAGFAVIVQDRFQAFLPLIVR